MNIYTYGLAALAAVALSAMFVFAVRLYFSKLVDRRIAGYQNDLLQKHFDEVQNIYRQMRGWKHDYHNHIQAMKVHASTGETVKLIAYLGELDSDLTAVDTVIKTGNIMLDAILNSKLSLAAARKINIDATAAAPDVMMISDIDLCVVIGNLLDNAAEACAGVGEESERFIRVYIGVLKSQLYISISNSSASAAKRLGGHYLSTKGENRGFGLMRVDRVIEKYGGFINRQNEDGVFATEVMLPL